MKIQCLDHKGSTPNTFLCKINQHTILINCPIETLTIPQPQHPQPEDKNDEQEGGSNGLGSILAAFSTQGKRTTDTQYSSLNTSIKNCDHPSVFRVPDFSLIDVNSIDLVLIANSESMLGLPFLTEYLGYKGRIIATEPTIEYGKQRMEELVLYHGHNSISRIEPALATHFSQLGDFARPSEGWRPIYNLKDVTSCVEKVQPVRYTETLSLFSTLNLVAFSSGYSLGSANWLLETSFKRIVFLSCSSLYANLHPAPFDADILKDADVVVVGGLSQQSDRELLYERAKSKLFVHLARTNQSLHNSIIVAPPIGILFDLIGDIEEYFKSLGKEIGHEKHQTPIYVANPIADQSLKYANICGEWMNTGRHNLLYVPQMPLAHGELMNTGAVEPLVSLEASVLSESSIREPCIVFTGDSTCITKGPLMWFLNHWGQSELNTCIFIDPNSPQDMQNDIPPDCKMNFIRLPLETRLKLEDISSILKSHWQHIGSHIRYLLIPAIQGAESVKEEQPQGIQVHVYDQGVVRINVSRDWERVSLSEKLAKTIDPAMVPNSDGTHFSAWAPINGSLNYYNNRLEIHPSINVKDIQSLVLGHESELRIHTELDAIIKRFEEHAIPISITKGINGITTIELPSDMNAKIIMNGSSTTVIASNDKVRTLLRQITVTDSRDLIAIENQHITTTRNAEKMPVIKDVEAWTSSKDYQSTLEHLKSKFTAKSTVVDIDMISDSSIVDSIPWKEFGSSLYNQIQKPFPSTATASKDYNNMLHDLAVSQTVMEASKFKPLDFGQAEKLVQKFQQLQQLVDYLYGRIRVQTDAQRATTAAFKLDQSSVADFIQDVFQSIQQTTSLIDEFYFATQSAHCIETRYLQHLAGTLALAVQQQWSPQEEIHRMLTEFLVKLEAIFNQHNGNADQQCVSAPSSTSSSSSASSSSSSSSSTSRFTQVESIDTSLSSVYTTATTSNASSTLCEKIDCIIEKISQQLKQKQESLRAMEIRESMHEELARQRERSANLVLELERSRSKRQGIAKKQEKDAIMLRDQLKQEMLRRQTLQERVSSLEHALKLKEAELTRLKKQPYVIKEEENHDSCQLQIKQLQQQLLDEEVLKENHQESKEKVQLALQQKLNSAEQDNFQLRQRLKRYSEEEQAWKRQKKSILDQCQDVMNVEFTNCEKAVTALVGHKIEQHQVKDAKHNLTDQSHLQQQLTRLQEQFDHAKQRFTTRESAFILQSASTEAELGRILKEYDRLTRNIVDFANERKKFEDEINMLHQDKQLLEKRICDEKISIIKESSLRKEFRSLMASVKDKHSKALAQELQKQRQLEQELRDIKSDIEMKRWEKVDIAVQTHYFDIVTA
ncbi:hypothetical protein [Parasitella parasitica]|uniref:Uncharacterized protein n=1 Tax=Parasitella parasitica TaxID=35722 RepID=A0A0B7NVM6_9FUNG|nr:hypothetical protein [Parasitella parasitica]